MRPSIKQLCLRAGSLACAALVLLCLLSGCGRQKKEQEEEPDSPAGLPIVEVRLTSFTAEGVSQNGEYNVDFQTLQYSGTTWSEERETISDTLSFWPQGNRTVSYPYGTISSSYIITFRSMNITAVSGSIYLMGRAAVS